MHGPLRAVVLWGRSANVVLPLTLAVLGQACSSSGAPASDDGSSGSATLSASGGAADVGVSSMATGTAGEAQAASSVPSAAGAGSSTTPMTPSNGGSTTGVGGASESGSGGAGGAGINTGAAGGGAAAGGMAVGGASTGGTGTGGVGGSGGEAVGGSAGAGGAATDSRSPGCGTTISRPNRNVQQTMEIGGTTRYYLLDVPETADNQTPLMLIFGLHGYDMNNVAVKDLYNFTERSNGQAITVMPQGEGPPPGDVSHWGDGVLESTWSAGDTNYEYIEALIATIGESYCIDTRRVFIVGFSMGAFFTNSIACAHGDWFRAFAPIAGGGPSSCGDGVEAAIMVQHGTADPIVDLSSGEDTRDTWLQQNGCSDSGTSSFNGCESYDGCPDDKPVVWCTGDYDHYIPDSVTSNIWAFFSGL